MYESKPLRRLKDWPEYERFRHLDCIAINGAKVDGPIATIRRALHFAASGRPPPRVGAIHGDLHFGNIFVDRHGGRVTLIDPRGRFGGLAGFVGDIYYDLAKLRHSYHAQYDQIIEGLYDLSGTEDHGFTLRVGLANDHLVAELDEELTSRGFQLRRVKAVEVGVLLSLIPFHHLSPTAQRAFFFRALLTALEVFNDEQ
jgi:hypothetical protein